jgi:hypothetical protein
MKETPKVNLGLNIPDDALENEQCFGGVLLPKEIKDPERFLEISEKANECRVKRLEDSVKLKLRTPSVLYTFRAEPSEADRLLKSVKCKVVEL